MSEEVYQRAHHAISEIQRTQEAVEVLKKGDYVKFGKFMTDSHNSLRQVPVGRGRGLDVMLWEVL